MSAPLELTPQDLRDLADAVEGLTEITRKTTVDFTSYGQLTAEVRGTSIRVGYSQERGYFLDDRVGS